MSDNDESTPLRVDALVIGAGFGGLYAVHRLRSIGLEVLGVERAPGVGGTWYWNRYPGARCDIESIDYQFGFDDGLVAQWRWTERYAAQPEILAYLQFVAERLDLERSYRFGRTVLSMHWSDANARWIVTTDDGRALHASFVVAATGNLTTPLMPDIPGVDDFEGTSLHTATWPTEPVELAGKRVGVIGTGSSGIQTSTTIAPVVGELTVFQRTPNYSMPAHNRPLTDDEVTDSVVRWRERRNVCEWSDAGTPLPYPTDPAVTASPEERVKRYEEGWARGGISSLSYAFNDMHRDEQSNAYAAEFARSKIREIVHDPAVAERLCPRHHIGTKRTCVDTGYFEIFNRTTVHLVDLHTQPIERITATGVQTAATHHDLDVLIFAVGFDAITGALMSIDVRGRNDATFADAWVDGPAALLGLQVAGFPNLFLVTGPGSPSVLSNMVISIEYHVDLITDAINHLREHGLATIEADETAQDDWMHHVHDLAAQTLYPQANSWYVGANIPGRPRSFPIYISGCGAFREECDRMVAEGYRGFVLRPAVREVHV